MCGRFTLTKNKEELSEALKEVRVEGEWTPRYNVAPSQAVATLLNDGQNLLTGTQWGLIPSWSKDPKIGHRLINARAETLHEKPAFRSSLKYKRCLIFADGFYEWKPARQGPKTPYYFRLTSGDVFGFAGLWDCWSDGDGGELLTSTIITTTPNDIVKEVHHRMPVILRRDDYDLWLSKDALKPNTRDKLLTSYTAEAMEGFPVTTKVNSPKNDVPDCIVPASRE